ncbi:PAS domain S-box protein [Microvirga aerilata]|uniref:Sensor protein FixL n=1 Tax=Microvirga aerilata TaxID=670292 RepID=A0A937D2H1_9HYPH|nr:PAS domain S-box protein [Microvirga aerilata]MBL0408136.1 PAS domain S-box protein [Microvirga aerilata]
MATSTFNGSVPAWDEVIRLAALQELEVLDTPPETAFDDIVQIAAEVCQTSTASVGFVTENRNWFKAKIGIEQDEIPSDVSFGSYAMRQDRLVVISDLREHPELRTNPFVTGKPGLRFYAGIALRNENGVPLGALVVSDSKVRPGGLSEAQERTLVALARSITREMKLKQAERELAQKTEMLNRLHASSDDCIKVLDLEGCLRFLNEGGCRAMEVGDFAQIEGCNWLGFWSGTTAEDARRAVLRARTGDTGRFRGFCPTLAGTPKWWDVVVTPIMGSDGKPDALLSISRDITGVQHAEESLRQSEERLRLAIETTGLGIWDVNLVTSERELTAEAQELFGFAPDTTITQELILERIHPDDRESVVQDFYSTDRAHSLTFTNTFRIIRADTGEERWISSLGHTLVDKDDRPTRRLGIAQDVTHHITAEEALRASQDGLLRQTAHLQSILSTVPDAMIVSDEKGIIRSFSATAVKMFGYQPEEIIGTSVKYLMPLPYRDKHDGIMHHYRQAGERPLTESGRVAVAQRKDGSTFPMEVHLGEMESGGERYFTAFIRDLTDRQYTEKRMQELQTELAYMSRLTAMGEMGSTLAHEVNQPLTAITGYLKGCGMILDRMDGEHVPMLRHGIEEATEEAHRAGEVIRQLRTFVARGETDQEIEDLRKLIEEASALALVGAKDKGVKVEFDLPHESPKVLVSRVQIQQVLLNLVRNAMEAMQEVEQRDLTIKAEMADTGTTVQLSVKDTGTGIAPTIIEKLFTPFTTTKKTGMGVGLSICRTIIEAHGGKIWAESAPREGTAFHFTLKAIKDEEIVEAEQGA